MSMLHVLALSFVLACGVDYTPVAAPGTVQQGYADARCAGAPDAPATEWRHLKSGLVAAYGESHHRGVDVIATTDDETQSVAGAIAYGGTDKALEDEDVSVFACVEGAWARVGGATTDGDGRFALTLTGTRRLGVGMRDLYVSVDGDRTGAGFVGLVLPTGAPVIASDVDGTLTASENAYPSALVLGGDVAAQAGAAETLAFAAGHGAAVVYVSSRGDRFTDDTRAWLAAKGFPRGPLRLAQPIVTLPGADTVEVKTAALATLGGLQLVAGVGNRATDVEAYGNAGLAADRIFIKLPEFTDELATDLQAGMATSFDDYELLRATRMASLLGE